MAEFEGKPDSAVCGTCEHYRDDPRVTGNNTGWCKCHWRLHQRHDTKTHRTNWCDQYKEAEVKNDVQRTDGGYGPLIEKADQVKDKIDNRHTDITDPEFGEHNRIPETPPSMSAEKAVIAELEAMYSGIKLMQTEVQQELLITALEGAKPDLWEKIGMLRAVCVVRETIEGRLAQLHATDNKTDAN